MTTGARSVILLAMDPRAKAVPHEWNGPISSWCASLRAQGLSSETVYLRRAHLAQLARAVDTGPYDVNLGQILDWLGTCTWGRETRRTHRSSYRGFFRHLGRHDIVDGLPRVRPTEPRPRPVPEAALHQALARADQRTWLILRLAAELGLRRGEIARIHVDDITPGPDATLLVHGKGDKQRVLPISDALAATMLLRADGWLFPSSASQTGHVAPAWVGKLATRALPSPWTLHKLRHRFATVVHEGTRDLVVVQELLGHASLATTQRYVATNQERMRAAIASAAA